MEKINLNNYRHVGKIMDAHGIKGEIYCLIFSGDADWAQNLKSFVLVRNQSEEEHRINKIKLFKKGFIAQLENFKDRNTAESYKSAEIWVHQDVFVSKNGESLFLSEILGFEVYDVQSGRIGIISDFSSNGAQDLLVVESNEKLKSYELPFVQDFVVDIDFATKKINMKLPEGLLFVNEKDYDNDDGSQTGKSDSNDEN